MSARYAARLNLNLVLLLPADTWFDSKPWKGHHYILLGRASLTANRDSALRVKTPAES